LCHILMFESVGGMIVEEERELDEESEEEVEERFDDEEEEEEDEDEEEDEEEETVLLAEEEETEDEEESMIESEATSRAEMLAIQDAEVDAIISSEEFRNTKGIFDFAKNLWNKYKCKICSWAIAKVVSLITGKLADAACNIAVKAACGAAASAACGPCSIPVCAIATPLLAKGCSMLVKYLIDLVQKKTGFTPAAAAGWLCPKIGMC